MFKNQMISAFAAATLMASVSGAAFAAGTDATASKNGNLQQISLTKSQKKEVEKQCKLEHKSDKAGYKACVKEKEKSTPAETGKM